MNRRLWALGLALVMSCKNSGSEHTTTATPPSPQVTPGQESSGPSSSPTPPATQPSSLVQPTGSGGNGTTLSGSSSGWLGGSMVQPRMMVGSTRETFAGFWVDTPAATSNRRLSNMDVSLVIDGSGSMQGEKIVRARQAASDLIHSLQDGDRVSVYVFNARVNEVVAPTVLDAASRARILREIQGISPSGNTNLYQGLAAATRAMNLSPTTHQLRRVIVISDGRANVGPTSTSSLGELASRNATSGAHVSTIGIGLDYDEHLLAAISQRSTGRMYHLETPAQVSEILREELQQLSDSVALDAMLEITPAQGVELLGVEGLPSEMDNGRMRVRLGNLYGSRHHEALVRVRINTATVGTHSLGTARLTYRDSNGAQSQHEETLPMSYSVASDLAAVNTNARVNAQVALSRASALQMRAAEQLNRGDVSGGTASLDQAERELRSAAVVAPTTATPAPTAAAPMAEAAPQPAPPTLPSATIANLNRQAEMARAARRSVTMPTMSRPAARSGSLNAHRNASDAYVAY